MKTASNREREEGKHHNGRTSEMADTMLKNYEQALHTGIKLQEEAGRWWSSVLNQTGFTQDWQKRITNLAEMASSLVPLTQKRMEELIELLEKNNRTSAELVKKAMDAAQTPALAESQAKWLDVWTSSMGAVRSNTEAVSEISSKAIDGWINFVRRNTEVTEVRVPKAT